MIDLTGEDREIYTALGEALAQWSGVEVSLAFLFVAVSDIPDYNRAVAAFDTILNFETRLAVIDRLMTFEAADEVETEMWFRLSDRLSRFYKKRHQLAHFMVGFNDKGRPAIFPFVTLDRVFTEQVRDLTLNQIVERLGKFEELSIALSWFKSRAEERRAPPPEVPSRQRQEPPIVSRLRELAVQSLARRKERPRPSPE